MNSENRVSFRFLLQKNDQKLVNVDSGVYLLLGYKDIDFIDEKFCFSDLFHTDDQDILSELFSLTPQKSPKNINFRCRQHSGKIICLQANFLKQYNKDSNALNLEINLIDARVLARPLVDQVLMTNFSAMMENTDDYIYFKDRNHVFTGASQTLVELTDPSEHWKDLLGKTDYDVFPEAYADAYYRLEKQVFSGQITVAHEVQEILDTDGNEGWVDNRKYPIKGESGEIIGLFGIARDITESKLLEQSLKESEQRFRTIFNESPLGIAVINSLTGNIYDANSAYELIAGRSVEELRILDWMKLTHPDDIQEDLDNMAQMNTGETSGFVMQKRYIQPDGTVRWINMSIAQMAGKDKSKPLHLCMTEDITQRKETELALQKSEEQFRTIFNEAPIGVGLIDSITGHICEVNLAYARIVDRSVEELQELDWMAITHPDDVQEDLNYMAQMNAGEISGFDMQKRLIRSNGSFVWVNMTIVWVQAEDKSKLRHLCLIENISLRKEAEDQLKLAALVFNNIDQGIIVTDKDNLIVTVNPAFSKLTGYSSSEVIGKDPKLLQSGRYEKSFYDYMWKSIEEKGSWQGEIWNKKKNGEEYAEQLSINSIYDEKRELSQRVALFTDITDKKIADEKIWFQANFDALTRLPNRSMFRDRLMHDIKVSQRTKNPLALLFLDLDHFKEVNDTLGHEKGDLLLIEVASRIRKCIRISDTVARLSGDEFTIILAELDDIKRVERIAEDIIRSLSKVFPFEAEEAYISASVGIAIYPDDAEMIDSLINHADQAMYIAKKNGRNQFSFFTREMQVSAHERCQLMIDLRFALRDEQFQLHYQPIVDLRTNQIVKAEALIRWNHPAQGWLNPVEFIALAEESGIIINIGTWVLQQVATQINEWQQRFNPDFQISINKSPVEFKSPANYLKWIDSLKELQVKDQSIVIDITEGLLQNQFEIVKPQLTELSQNGIQIAVDDFGTGCSALSNINNLYLNYLKINPSLIQNLTAESSQQSYCEVIVVMAHKFGLKVIAEGVETEEQKQLLVNAGCDYGQGYLFSKPVPEYDFEKLLIQQMV